MRDVLLFAAVVGFMILGFFIVDMIDKFLDENYKGYEENEDEAQSEDDAFKNKKNKDNTLP